MLFRSVCKLLAFVFAFLAVGCVGESRSAEALELEEKGIGYLFEGNYELAAELCRQAYERSPDSNSATCWLVAELYVRDLSGALAALEKLATNERRDDLWDVLKIRIVQELGLPDDCSQLLDVSKDLKKGAGWALAGACSEVDLSVLKNDLCADKMCEVVAAIGAGKIDAEENSFVSENDRLLLLSIERLLLSNDYALAAKLLELHDSRGDYGRYAHALYTASASVLDDAVEDQECASLTLGDEKDTELIKSICNAKEITKHYVELCRSATGLLNFGVALARMNRVESALDAFEKAALLAEDPAVAYLYSALVCWKKQDKRCFYNYFSKLVEGRLARVVQLYEYGW